MKGNGSAEPSGSPTRVLVQELDKHKCWLISKGMIFV
jgi:hypothetical protein